MLNLFLKYKTKKLLKNSKREKVFLNWEQIHSVLIVFDTRDYEEVDALIEYLEKKGKKVKSYAYKNKNDNYDYSETPHTIVSKKGLNGWSGDLDRMAERLKKEKMDLALDLNLKRNSLLEYIFIAANASLKAGYKKTDRPIYDVTITALPVENKESPRPIMELAKQIIYYLSKIKN